MKNETNFLSPYLTYSFLGALFIMFLLLLYVELKDEKVSGLSDVSTNQIPSVNFLTSDEVAQEKNSLINLNSTPNIFETKDIVLTEDDVKVTYNSEVVPQEINNTQQRVETGNQNFTVTYSPDAKIQSEAEKNSVSELKPENPNEQKVVKTFTGRIYSKNYEENTITIYNNTDGFVAIKLTSATKIKINDKIMSPNDLKVGDSLLVEGLAYQTTNYLFADTILVTGTLNVI